ncbi:L-asparaginase [Fusarium oxysporum f. sp. albedinis]|nr:L-asparaginase [Fusarium oxysporum f. sp. albedinis]
MTLNLMTEPGSSYPIYPYSSIINCRVPQIVAYPPCSPSHVSLSPAYFHAPYRVTLSNINTISANINPNQQQAAPARQATPARPAAPAQQARAAPTNLLGPIA